MEDISIHDIDVRGVDTAFRVEFNWYPNYSYAKIPEGMSNVPAYWRILAQAVPAEKGLPHLRNVRVSNVKGADVGQAFSVDSYPSAPVQNLTFTNVEIDAQRAGTIQNAENWKFIDSRIKTADGSGVTLKDSSGVTGLAGN